MCRYAEQRKWNKKFGEQLDTLGKKAAEEKTQLVREGERAEEAGFEVAVGGLCKLNSVLAHSISVDP